MNKLDSLGSLQRELQQCLGIEQDMPVVCQMALTKNGIWHFSIFYRENLVDQCMGLLGVPNFWTNQTMIRFIHGVSTCQSRVLLDLFFLVGLWCLRQQWQKDLGSTAQPVPSARVVRIGGRNECFQGFARTSNSKMQFQAARHHWRVKIGSKWGIGLLQIFSCRMDCHDCWSPFWMVPVVPARGGAEVALGL